MRLLIPDLLPGVSYAIQVRADGGALQSEWSNRFEITTTLDTEPPDVPEWAPSNEWVVNGDTFSATWQALNFTLAQNLDFDHYELELSDSILTRVVRTDNTSYTLTFETNRIYFGTAKPTVTARVRSVDKVGNASAWTSLKSATNPAPSAPSSIGVTSLYDSIKVDWESVSDIDLVGYKVQVSTTSSSTGFTDVYNGPDVSYTHSTTAFLTDHWYRVYAVDKFGTSSSSTTSSAVKPKSALSVDVTPPTAPTTISTTQGFDATKQEAWANIAWTASVSTDVGSYEVRYSTTAGTNWQYVSAGRDVTAVRIEGLIPSTAYYIDVRAVDWTGNASAWVNEVADYPITTTADSTAPSQPSAPTSSVGTQKLQVVVDGLKQAGGSMEADVAYYEVFASTSTGFTTYNSTTMLGTIQKGPAMIETFQIPAQGSSGTTETWYVKVRAVDRSGNISPASNQATAAVGLILTANIGDAQITNAKINDLSANKITAGTITAQTINIGSTGVLNIDSTGVIKSNNYVANTSGFQLTNTSLEINNGSIAAAALKIQDGNNMMTPKYADFEGHTAGYSSFYTTGSTQTPSIITSLAKFNSQALRTQWAAAGTAPTLYLVETNTYNIIVEALNTYIVSGYFWNTGAVNTSVSFRVEWADSAGASISTSLVQTATINASTAVGSAQRLSGAVTAPTGAVKARVYVIGNTLTANAGYNLDGVQFERQQGALTTPSSWKPPSSTIIDGGLIRTGEIRSNTDLTLNGITLPTWSINAGGAAQFGNLLVRGSVIVGQLGEDTGTGSPAEAQSFIKSYNYSPGTTGWAIYSNGWSEFRSMSVGSLSGNALTPGTVAADSLVASSVLSREIIVTGSIHTKGEMGEDIGIDNFGFHVLGAYQASVVTSVLASNLATLTTDVPHGFTVGKKLVVTGVGDPYDGEWTISSLPSSTQVRYVVSNADIGSTSVIGGVVKSLSAILERPKLIDFPSDGSSPNIISGTLSADTLTVTDGASFRGSNSVDNGIFEISSGVLAPKTSPVAVQGYQTTPLIGGSPYQSEGYNDSSGFCKGHNGNYFVLTFLNAQGEGAGDVYDPGRPESFMIQEFNSTTGQYVGTVLDMETYYSNSTEYPGEKGNFEPRNLIYSATTGKYYIALTDWNYGSHTTPWDYPPTIRRETIWALSTAFVVQGKLAPANDSFNDAGWLSSAVGYDYVNGTPRLIHLFHDGVNLKSSYITLTSGLPTGTATYSTVTGAGNLTSPKFVARVNDMDGGSLDRIIIKDYVNNGGTVSSRWSPFTTAFAVQANEQWEGPANQPTYGGYYDTTDKCIYALNLNGVIKYESGDSYWSSDSSMTATRWVRYSWYDSNHSSTNTVTFKELTSNVAKLTTGSVHGFHAVDDIGKWVEVRGVDAVFNGWYQIASVPTTTTFTYAKTSTNVSSTAVSPVGSVKRGTYETPLSPFYKLTFKKRNRITVTVGVIPYQADEVPNTADSARIYMANTVAQPTLVGTVSSSWHLRGTISYPNNSMVLAPVSNNNGDIPLNTVTNTFNEVSAPSRFISTAKDTLGAYLIDISGDGAGRMGPYQWDNTGLATIPAISVYKTTSQSLTAATTSEVLFNVVRSAGTGGMVLASGTVTVPRAGWYQVNGCITWASSTSSARRILFIGTGTTPGTLTNVVHSNTIAAAQDTANFTTQSISATVYLAAGSVVGLSGNPSVNFGLDVSQTYMNNLSVHWVG